MAGVSKFDIGRCCCVTRIVGQLRKYGSVASNPGDGEWIYYHGYDKDTDGPTVPEINDIAVDGSTIYYGGLRVPHGDVHVSLGACDSNGNIIWEADAGPAGDFGGTGAVNMVILDGGSLWVVGSGIGIQEWTTSGTLVAQHVANVSLDAFSFSVGGGLVARWGSNARFAIYSVSDFTTPLFYLNPPDYPASPSAWNQSGARVSSDGGHILASWEKFQDGWAVLYDSTGTGIGSLNTSVQFGGHKSAVFISGAVFVEGLDWGVFAGQGHQFVRKYPLTTSGGGSIGQIWDKSYSLNSLSVDSSDNLYGVGTIHPFDMAAKIDGSTGDVIWNAGSHDAGLRSTGIGIGGAYGGDTLYAAGANSGSPPAGQTSFLPPEHE